MAGNGTVNKFIAIGRLGADPESRDLGNGRKVIRMSVATGEKWTDKATGEKKERTDWHSVGIFNDKLGQVAMEHLHKGDRVFVEGALRYSKYTDKDGIERSSAEIVIDAFNGTFEMLGSPTKPEVQPDTTSQAATTRAAKDPWDE